ncbi:transcription factor LHW-like isoform X2 [Lotus japonicus]|uniref:transcription factor LHW-like isoform X2 n=1 Tax=Lotus japonicus TaxID=34305 RepID=UPI002582FC0D|nr:transcription factor LHW-like isoform X2 [Lotus japonicus]XP_057440282.1 transcription factor LHW-like isoform X2 [Lotus japonicus]XP_057440283.1 transcription factor LHW-like isoform X2 [Lotus japonicus]
MLVEMLCEERGFFLEIADLIRGLDFTILKGVMEARNDKIWARFAVEEHVKARLHVTTGDQDSQVVLSSLERIDTKDHQG